MTQERDTFARGTMKFISTRILNIHDTAPPERKSSTLPRRRTHFQPGWKNQRKNVLNTRLKELLVFEITRDGSREYRNMTLRSLYNYVLAAIATKPKHLLTASTSTRLGLNDFSKGTRRNTADSLGAYLSDSPQLDALLEDKIAQLENDDVDDGGRPVDEKTNPQTSRFPGDSRRVAFDQQKNNPLLGGKRRPTAFGSGDILGSQITHRERLGGYLHPRDMRRLVTPFSASNESELIVRRHTMLMNFDPLRAIILRDRLLVLVPDGADSILETLAKRIKGGLTEIEDSVFGSDVAPEQSGRNNGTSAHGSAASSGAPDSASDTESSGNAPMSVVDKHMQRTAQRKRPPSRQKASFDQKSSGEDGDAGTSDDNDDTLDSFDDFLHEESEWDELQEKNWIDLPFELRSVDAVLHTVTMMLTDEANDLQEYAYDAIEDLLESHTAISGEHGHDILRSMKGEITQMSGRVQGFVRSINQVLDNDEDMALMNLSRLITHPERFIQPVSDEILHEESDEPELILEAYLQQSLSNTNALELLRNEVATTEELINMQLDTVRNRLLYINTVVSLLTLSVGIGSFVGSIFGMNLPSGLEDNESAFRQVVLGTCFGGAGMLIFLVGIFYRAGTLPKVL